jgi:3-hydroxyisobutyrate dehydrogenase-like beta-hydroxyacid dehydrogenase
VAAAHRLHDAGPWALITCLPHAQALSDLWPAPSAWPMRLAGSTVIDHTTCGVALAQQPATQCAQQAGWLDAPLSGGVAGAEARQLSAMLGGAHETEQAARDLLASYCASVEHLGPVGAGQAAKRANQLAIAGTHRGRMADTRDAQAQGLDVAACLVALASGSAHSVQMTQHRTKLLEHAARCGSPGRAHRRHVHRARGDAMTEVQGLDMATRPTRRPTALRSSCWASCPCGPACPTTARASPRAS